jgi:hypothetical protein
MFLCQEPACLLSNLSSNIHTTFPYSLNKNGYSKRTLEVNWRKLVTFSRQDAEKKSIET